MSSSPQHFDPASLAHEQRLRRALAARSGASGPEAFELAWLLAERGDEAAALDLLTGLCESGAPDVALRAQVERACLHAESAGAGAREDIDQALGAVLAAPDASPWLTLRLAPIVRQFGDRLGDLDVALERAEASAAPDVAARLTLERARIAAGADRIDDALVLVRRVFGAGLEVDETPLEQAAQLYTRLMLQRLDGVNPDQELAITKEFGVELASLLRQLPASLPSARIAEHAAVGLRYAHASAGLRDAHVFERAEAMWAQVRARRRAAAGLGSGLEFEALVCKPAEEGFAPVEWLAPVRVHLHDAPLDVIALQGRDERVLALIEGGHAPLVVLDAWGRTVPLSAQELIGVAALSEALKRQDHAGLLDAARQVPGAQAKGDLERTAGFWSQLHLGLTSELGDDAPPELGYLLPWPLFAKELTRFTRALSDGNPVDGDVGNLRDAFRSVAPGMAASLHGLNSYGWSSDGATARRAMTLLKGLSRADASALPIGTLHALLPALNTLANSARDARKGQKSSAETARNFALAEAEARTFITRLRRVLGNLDLRSELGNLANAVVALDSVGILDRHARLLDHRLGDELRDAARRLPDPLEVAVDQLDQRVAEEIRFNAADVLRAVAKLALLAKDVNAATAALETAQAHFQALDRRRSALSPGRRKRLLKRWARADRLLAELVAPTDTDRAERLVQHAEQLLVEDGGAGDYGTRMLLASTLVDREVLVGSEHPSPALQLLEQLTRERPGEAPAWNALADYHMNVRDDAVTAYRVIARWHDIATHDPSTKGPSRDYVQWRAAKACSEASLQDERLRHEAVDRYIGVLRDQPSNTVAAGELLALLERLTPAELSDATQALLSRLPSVEDSESTVVHAAVLSAVADIGATIDDPHTSRQALAVLASSLPDTDPRVEQALRVLSGRMPEDAPQRWKTLGIMIEFLTRTLQSLAAGGSRLVRVRAADRLLRLVFARRRDAVWWTRRAELVLEQGHADEAARLLEERSLLGAAAEEDDYIVVYAAKLDALLGNHDDAVQRLDQRLAKGSAHAAVSMTKARLLLEAGDVDGATAVYDGLLIERPYDPATLLGRGRAALQRENWGAAWRDWLQALRLHVLQGSGRSSHAWLCACSLAALCSERPSEAADWVGRTLDQEHPTVGTTLIKAVMVTQAGRTNLDRIAQRLLERARQPLLQRATAQFLMATTLGGVLDPSSEHLPIDEIREHAEWCRHHGVLEDFVGGAKGSYQRTLLRLQTAGRSPVAVDHGDKQELERVLGLDGLMELVASTSYSSEYYAKVKRLLAAGRRGHPVAFAMFIVLLTRFVAGRIAQAEAATPEALLSSVAFAPSIVHGHQLENAPAPTVFVDLDALRYVERRLAATDATWQLDRRREVVELALADLPPEELTRPLRTAGVRFERENGVPLCVVGVTEPVD